MCTLKHFIKVTFLLLGLIGWSIPALSIFIPSPSPEYPYSSYLYYENFMRNPAFSGETGNTQLLSKNIGSWLVRRNGEPKITLDHRHLVGYQTHIDTPQSGLAVYISYNRDRLYRGRIFHNPRLQFNYNYKFSFDETHYLRAGINLGLDLRYRFYRGPVLAERTNDGRSTYFSKEGGGFELGVGGAYRNDDFLVALSLQQLNGLVKQEKPWLNNQSFRWILFIEYAFALTDRLQFVPRLYYTKNAPYQELFSVLSRGPALIDLQLRGHDIEGSVFWQKSNQEVSDYHVFGITFGKNFAPKWKFTSVIGLVSPFDNTDPFYKHGQLELGVQYSWNE